MTATFRWFLVAVFASHGLIHLLGVVTGFGWADVAQLTKPIGVVGGVVWLVAAVLVLTATVFLAMGVPTWRWAAALGAAVISQIAIATSWQDARAGTIVNLILVMSAGYGFAAGRPSSSKPDTKNVPPRRSPTSVKRRLREVGSKVVS
ncbi:hypothetical protein [Nocardioides sp.]|uniref:hypothetical protein n=1 Tax=Nocardioides sp. TaxID=35761 RepID=UPI00260D4848|nr:hypothetical protein [Nocardioides sp.]